MAQISLLSIVQQSENQVWSEVDNETILMNIVTGEYYGHDETGKKIWEQMQLPKSVSEIVDAMMAQFEAEREQCERDVLSFINQLVEHDLAVIVKD